MRVDTPSALAEQGNAHRGHVVVTQTEHVADVVGAMAHEERDAVHEDVRRPVLLVTDLMGEVFARMVAQLLGPTVTLARIIDFNPPPRFLSPVPDGPPMLDVYGAIAVAAWKPSDACPASPLAATFTRLTSSELLYC